MRWSGCYPTVANLRASRTPAGNLSLFGAWDIDYTHRKLRAWLAQLVAQRLGLAWHEPIPCV